MVLLGEITLLIQQAGQREAGAVGRLYELHYTDLRRIARSSPDKSTPDEFYFASLPAI